MPYALFISEHTFQEIYIINLHHVSITSNYLYQPPISMDLIAPPESPASVSSIFTASSAAATASNAQRHMAFFQRKTRRGGRKAMAWLKHGHGIAMGFMTEFEMTPGQNGTDVGFNHWIISSKSKPFSHLINKKK